MSKRKGIALLLLVLVAVSIGVTPSIIQFAAESALIKLKQRGVRIQADGIKGFLAGVSAESVESWITIKGSRAGGRDSLLMIPDFPIQLRAESVRLSAGFTPFLPSSHVNLSGTLYGGTLQMLARDLLSHPIATGSLNRIDLSLHPQLRALGLEQGTLTVSIVDHPLSLDWSMESRYELSIEQVAVVPPPLVRTLSGISLLQDGQIDATAAVTPGGGLTIQSGSFDSSLASGAIKGTGIIRPNGQLSNINGTVELRLNRSDSPKIGAMLPILTNQAVSSESQRILCSIRSASCGSNGAVPIGNECVRVSCAGS